MSDKIYPCPSCGHLVHRSPPGSFHVCIVCFWEDDLSQLRWPTSTAGANRVSLVNAQKNYASIGACEPRFNEQVKTPNADEPTDEGWRPIDLSIDNFEAPGRQEAPWPDDRTVLYWWRPTFWRSAESPNYIA